MLAGKFNSFAKAAARGELPKSSPLHKAAAFDLDILQKLAVAETTLVSWVEDVSRSLPEGWAAAGLFGLQLVYAGNLYWQSILCGVSNYTSPTVHNHPIGSHNHDHGHSCADIGRQIWAAFIAKLEPVPALTISFDATAAAYGPSTNPQLEASKSELLDIPSDLSAPAFIKGPLTPSQRTAWRASIGGKWKWSEALPELQYYYEAHGFGITAVNSTLKWAGGHLEAYDIPKSTLAYGCHVGSPMLCKL